MNNTISPMNNVSFQAKLDISKVKGSKQRWQNIAKMFEEKTKSCPKDVLHLEGDFNNGFYINLIEKNSLCFDEIKLSRKASNELKKISDKYVMKNFVDIFKLMKNTESSFAKQESFVKKINLDKIEGSKGEALRRKFYRLMSEIREANNSKFVKEHPIFKDGGINIS